MTAPLALPGRAIRCFISPPPRSASMRPHCARSMASRRSTALILALRAKRWNPLVW